MKLPILIVPLLLTALGCLAASAQESAEELESVFDQGLERDKESDSIERDIALMRVVVDDELRTVAIVLFDDEAPGTCKNFREKCAEGYYNGLSVHRAIPGFLVQTGDPLSRDPSARADWGTGGPSYTVPFEKTVNQDGEEIGHSKGAVAMARLEDSVNPSRASHASQFYISLGKNSALNGKYTVFGKVVRGMDVIEKISQVDVDVNDNPLDRIAVDSVRIIAAGERIPGTVDERRIKKLKDFERKRKGDAIPESEKSGFAKLLERFW